MNLKNNFSGLTFLFLVFFQTSVSAVQINDNATGQALIFPFYSVANDHNTLVTIKNNTDSFKAVKVDFRESFNGATVLNFNLYLAPYDEWSGALAATLSSISGYEGQPSATLISNDASCRPFVVNSQEFLPFALALDAGPDNMQRAQTGFIQVTEMGELGGATYPPAVEHTSGVPNNCAVLEASMNPGGEWSIDPSTDILPATGGLSGSFSIIEVAQGYAASGHATAINRFYSDGGSLHTITGNTDNGLSALDDISRQLSDDGVYAHMWQQGFESLSAPLMREFVYLNFDLNVNVSGVSETILTFPTKSFYVNNVADAVAPFTTTFSANGACETAQATVISQDLSSSTETLPAQSITLCESTNVIGYSNNMVTPTPLMTDSYQSVIDAAGFETGSIRLDFSDFLTNQAFDLEQENFRYLYFGLPVISFNFQRYANSNAQNGPVLYAYQNNVASQSRIIPETIFFNAFD
ncbi:hypothetical protein [Marinicella sp. W31]|uniref:hypothetical protein n=1 Tax=Marinicella sp. W31 TaxID=3023713 RepID=UPI0037570700